MPNYTSNTFALSGALPDIEALLASVAGHDDDGVPLALDFQKIVPQPADLPDHAIYSWQVEHWGCRSGACDVYVSPPVLAGSQYVSMVSFETPWSPAEPIFRALQEQHRNVHIVGFYDTGETSGQM